MRLKGNPDFCDVVFVMNDSIFAKAVKFFTRHKNEEPTQTAHCACFLTPEIVIESLIKTKISYFYEGAEKHPKYEIGRKKKLNTENKKEILGYLYKGRNTYYGLGKLFFHGIDGVLSKFTNNDVFGARKVLKSERYPICSGLIAFAYYKGLDYKFGIDPKYATPDDLHDFIKSSDEGELIHRS